MVFVTFTIYIVYTNISKQYIRADTQSVALHHFHHFETTEHLANSMSGASAENVRPFTRKSMATVGNIYVYIYLYKTSQVQE